MVTKPFNNDVVAVDPGRVTVAVSSVIVSWGTVDVVASVAVTDCVPAGVTVCALSVTVEPGSVVV